MSDPVFPVTLAPQQDSKFYDVAQEDPAQRAEMEGGYVVTRARFTRRPRKTFTTGFTSLKDADYLVLQAFYDTVRGGSLIFDWTNPPTNTVVKVRFVGGPLKGKYAGVGNNKRWDVSFQLEEA